MNSAAASLIVRCRSALSIPAEIAAIAFHNKAEVYDILFPAASGTMLTIAADPRHLGARIGITAVLHTWGSALTHHPHPHMRVPGDGPQETAGFSRNLPMLEEANN